MYFSCEIEIHVQKYAIDNQPVGCILDKRNRLMKRRHWLAMGIATPALLAQNAAKQPCLTSARRSRIAAVVTVYHHYSHADVLLGRLMSGYTTNSLWTPSQTQLVALHTDQSPDSSDMSRDLAARNGFRRFASVREALTLGGQSLAVDGVVFIGEHGDYPLNDVGQTLYPLRIVLADS